MINSPSYLLIKNELKSMVKILYAINYWLATRVVADRVFLRTRTADADRPFCPRTRTDTCADADCGLRRGLRRGHARTSKCNEEISEYLFIYSNSFHIVVQKEHLFSVFPTQFVSWGLENPPPRCREHSLGLNASRR